MTDAERLSTLETAVSTIIKAMQKYLPPDSKMTKDEFISEVIGAVDNPEMFRARNETSEGGVNMLSSDMKGTGNADSNRAD